MRIRTLQDLRDSSDYFFEMCRKGRGIEGARVLISVYESVDVRSDQNEVWALVSHKDGTIADVLCEFVSEDEALGFKQSIDHVLTESRRALSARQAEEDFPGEYQPDPQYKRSNVFRTPHFLNAINKVAERVETGLDDPENGLRIV